MIVEITSLTPRVTFSSPAMPAQIAPTPIATISSRGTCSTAGRCDLDADDRDCQRRQAVLPLDADVEQAIRNPIATASPDR